MFLEHGDWGKKVKSNRRVSQKQGALRERRVVWYLVEPDKKIDLELCGGGGL